MFKFHPHLRIALLAIALLFPQLANGEVTTTVDFETFPLTFDGFETVRGPFPDNQTSVDGPFGGTDISGTVTVDGLTINNTFNDEFLSFTGFAASQRGQDVYQNTQDGFEGYFDGNDTVTASGDGEDNSATWVVSFGSGNGVLEVDDLSTIQSVSLNNTETTVYAVENGQGVARRFGSLDQDESFLVRFVDLDEGDSLDFELASFDSVNEELFVLKDWTSVDLSSLNSRRIGIEFQSTDTGTFGINTPMYVALDNVVFTTVPEPTAASVLLLCGCFATYRRLRKGKIQKPSNLTGRRHFE